MLEIIEILLFITVRWVTAWIHVIHISIQCLVMTVRYIIEYQGTIPHQASSNITYCQGGSGVCTGSMERLLQGLRRQLCSIHLSWWWLVGLYPQPPSLLLLLYVCCEVQTNILPGLYLHTHGTSCMLRTCLKVNGNILCYCTGINLRIMNRLWVYSLNCVVFVYMWFCYWCVNRLGVFRWVRLYRWCCRKIMWLWLDKFI